MPNVITATITKTSGVCGGRACIAGHRVRVMDIVGWHETRGMSAAEVVAMFPGITIADVQAAMDYYKGNAEEIQEDFRKDEEWARWAESNLAPLIPPMLKEKIVG